MGFITEKETEALLEQEIRNITLPNGSIRSLSSFRLTWDTFDKLIRHSRYTEEKLVKLGVINAEEKGLSLELSFQSVIAYVYHHFKDICNDNIDKKIAYIEKRLGILNGKAKINFNQASR